MVSLCNESSMWDTDETWYNTWPQFTDCFQSTVLVWVPCGWLWLTSPFYTYYILNVTKTDLTSRWKYYLRQVLCVCLVIISVIQTAITASEEDAGQFSSHYVSPIIQIFTFILALILMFLERRKGFVTSGVLFIFWLLLTVAGIVPFYTKIILKDYEEHISAFTVFYIYYALVVAELFLSCLSESVNKVSDEKSACPEVSSSFLSRITFWWNNVILMRGYRKVLTECDVCDLHPRDLADNNVPSFMSHLKEYKVKERHKERNGLQHSAIYSKSSTDIINVFPSDEKTPLIPKSSKATVKGSTDQRGGVKYVSIVTAIRKTMWFDILQSQVWKFIYDLLYFTNPLLLGELINFTEDKTTPEWKGYTLGIIMFCSILIQSLSFHASWHQSTSVAIRVRSVLISAIFRKALTMSSQAQRESTVGEIVNLMSVDTEHIKVFMQFLFGGWSSALQIAISLYLLYNTLGLAMLAGLGVILIVLPCMYIIMSLWNKYQAQMMALKDQRLKILNEVLNGMKILKLYAWEPSFSERITSVRRTELVALWKIAILQASTMFTWTVCPYLLSLATFLAYIYTSPDHYLNPQTAFVAISLLNNLRLAVIILPEIFSDFVRAFVSAKRINKYLNSTDLDESMTEQNPKQENSVSISDGTFLWNEEIGPILRNINMRVGAGELMAIVGQVGTGKSSLLSAILGEMNKLQGHVGLKGSIAYVSQQAWIQHDTLQNNILFGKPMNRELYDKVVECCALKPDLEMLPGGDQTEIGERGINLSGGQKQRVSLARAVYNDADIYLLDDPLSAVDSHVGKHIFDKLISKGGLIGKKTRILVTHGIQWLPKVDCIIVVTNGQISETGTYEQLLQHNGPFAQFLQTYLLEHQDNTDPEETEMKRQVLKRLESVTSEDDTEGGSLLIKSLTESLGKSLEIKKIKEHTEDEPVKDKHKIVEEEVVEVGKVPWSVYGSYAKAVGWRLLGFCVLLYVIYTASSMSSNIWLSQWTDNPDLNNLTLYPPNSSERLDKNNFYLGIYGGLGAVQALSILVFSFLWGFRCVHASRAMHDGMLISIMKAPMAFFDTTPAGRIVNRFSQDIEAIDVLMPHHVEFSMNTFFNVLSCVIVISYSTPIFLVVVVPLFILYYFILVFYINTSRQLKRLESKTRSPVYNHFGETLNGSAVIRAFKAQSRFIKESEKRVDANNKYAFYAFASQRWLGFRLETLGNMIVLAASLFAVASRDTLSGGVVGLSISYALQITQNLNWFVRMASELETNIVSVERVKEYSEVAPEASWSIADKRPDMSWPVKGVVKFLDYSTRYRPGLDLVLKGISCTVQSGEKVGIVGRTGAGKSSLTLSLFRLIEAAGGEINIDGVDISTIGLHDLRKKLTILPQGRAKFVEMVSVFDGDVRAAQECSARMDPVLFAGSLRENVDPFNQYSDSEIWRALDHAHLKRFVQSLPGTLEHDCSEGGENMSVGQRQLLCLARALLKKTKILVLDEATAAVDMETDDLIQQTIRSEFKECTVLTIAHRLNTVMDYDRILVLDNGRVLEYDSPSSLLQQESSVFYDMAKSAGLVS